MKADAIREQILKATRESGKTYAFNEQHDERLPAQWWFQESHEGPVLFVVFYSQACRWSRCLGCNLPSTCSQDHVGYAALMAQIDHLFALPALVADAPRICKVIASNNGSMLDEVTFSSTALIYLIAKANLQLPNLKVLTIESRPEYVDLPELEFLARVLREGDTPTALEIAVGFEVYDEHIRNRIFRKGLGFETFERFVADVAPFGFRVKCYLMQKPVADMTDEDAIADITRAIDYFSTLSSRLGVTISVHLNPTFVAAGTELAGSFAAGEYAPPHLRDVAKAALHARGKGLDIFLGLNDEGLGVPGGSFVRPGEEELVAALEHFNRTQDFGILDALV